MSVCDNILLAKQGMRKCVVSGIPNHTFSTMNYPLPSSAQYGAHSKACMLVTVHRLYFTAKLFTKVYFRG